VGSKNGTNPKAAALQSLCADHDQTRPINPVRLLRTAPSACALRLRVVRYGVAAERLQKRTKNASKVITRCMHTMQKRLRTWL